MKKLLVAVVLMLATTLAYADAARDAHIKKFEVVMVPALKAQGVSRFTVTDTGEELDLGQGPGPVVIVRMPTVGRECLVGIHPTDPEQMAIMGCVEIEKDVDL